MPSVTDDNGYVDSGHGHDLQQQPILGTGLNIPSLQLPLISESNTPKHHRAPVQKKATARPPANQSASNPLNSSQPSSAARSEVNDEKDHVQLKPREEDPYSSFFSQVQEWLQHERARRKAARKTTAMTDGAGDDHHNHDAGAPLERSPSQTSDTSSSLDKLEGILAQHADRRQEGGFGTRRSIRRRPVRGLRSASLSDSDHPDFEAAAPSVETFLDNTKTLASGAPDMDDDDASLSAKQAKDKENWLTFKCDILRIVQTLQIKGWRKVSMDFAGDVDVTRLSGALTNAVYVVAPPPLSILKPQNGSSTSLPRRTPPKLLLRIYGPQVEHLIDREKELQILRRLSRKNIGPRVLGTFLNGRFEQFYNARPLTPNELRIPDMYRQIAKRMRELHEGIELQPEERNGGPIVFKNWDKWVDRCEQVINWLDKEIQSKHNEVKAQVEPWRRRGFVCGVPWPVFRRAVEKYREFLVASCGGFDEIKKQLVFAHNDTQYGNLLRLEPTGESPLLTPANEHKQLVVIDFEYASANTPGFEFANHFSEWCYNYHDPEKPWALHNNRYPKPEDQHRFISEYLKHKPGLSASSPFTTPSMMAMPGNTSRLAPLDLDADSTSNPNQHPAATSNDSEFDQEALLETDVQYFMRQTRLWRVFNSAQWVAWGIVQAKVPGMEEGIAAMEAAKEANAGETTAESPTPPPSTSSPPPESDGGENDEFDYLAYSQERAMFFWADMLSLGLTKKEELPGQLVESAKFRALDY